MQRHLDDETLARLAAAEDADALADRHLSRCSACHQRLRDLRAVRYTLGTLPVPPLPDDLAHAITTRLADDTPPEPGGRRKPRRLIAMGPRHLGFAAAIAVGAGGLSMALTGGGSSASSTLPNLTATDNTPADTPTVSTAATATSALRDSGNRVLAPTGTLGTSIPVNISADDYHHTTLGDGVNALFRSGAMTSTADVTEAIRSAVVPSGECLRAVGRVMDHAPATTWTLVGVQVARFNGRPATVLAFIATDSRSDQIVVAVDGTCSGPDPLVLDQAVVSTRVDS